MKMLREISFNDTFVCLDDISGVPEEMNYVIYNPTKDEKHIIPVKLYQYIFNRFEVRISPDEMLRLISYDRYHLAEFVHDLREIVNKKKK